MTLSVLELQRVQYLRTSMMFDAIMGNYKEYKEAKKEYATLAVKGFEQVRKLPMSSVNAPIITKYGLNMLSVAIRDFFRVKTQDEKLLKKMGKEALKKEKLDKLA